MKKLLLTLVFAATTPAMGMYHGPLAVKSSGGGFTPPEWSRHETCELYIDKVVITRHYAGEFELKETRAIEVAKLIELIEQAASEEITSEDNFLCDAPSTGIRGIRILPNDGVEDFTIYQTGGCGSPRITREGAASRIIREMLDVYCSKTY